MTLGEFRELTAHFSADTEMVTFANMPGVNYETVSFDTISAKETDVGGYFQNSDDGKTVILFY